MNTFSDRMSTFTQEVLTRFADELPEETFHRVSDIVLRELQYQQIQEKIYVPLKEFLDALQKNSDTNKKIIKRIDAMLASNVQQLQRDDKQMNILQDLKKEQASFNNSVQHLSEEVETNLQQQLISNIKQECSEIVHSISQKMENATVQHNKDNTSISNQISMLIEIHKQFIDEFKNSDVAQSIEKATSKIEDLQKESIEKMSVQLDNIPELIQSEILEAIDQQEILDTLKEQQNFISNKLEERIDSAPSLEESQVLLQPIQEAVLDQGGQLESMLGNIQDSIAELQIQNAEVAEESTTTSQTTPNVTPQEIEQKISKLFEPLVLKLEDALLENIRPKDLDTMKKSLAKMMETGFWRIEQLVENNASPENESEPNLRKETSSSIKNQLQKIENLLNEKTADTTTNNHESIIKELNKSTQDITKHVIDDINTHFSELNFSEKLTTIEDKLEKINEQHLNIMQKKLDDITHHVQESHEHYQKLQESITNVENKVLSLAIEIDNNKEPKVAITCPHCAQEVTGVPSMEGQRVLCRHCREEFTFPKP
ncbi:hypothetical protein [Candidatus Uabimicrobium sp. HlEnr_7]|uniref:hypothetical protein n=1 Tax=Candidatus Uabimicrobium helgolandensis TaxID=3095367 RepID=UPI0035563ED5